MLLAFTQLLLYYDCHYDRARSEDMNTFPKRSNLEKKQKAFVDLNTAFTVPALFEGLKLV